jgi:hypothetical protein
MSPLLENILVGVIVTAAAAWAVRAMWRSRKQDSGCGGCSESGSCASSAQGSNPMPLQDLTTLGEKRQP